MALFNSADHIAFFVKQKGRDLNRQLHHHPACPIFHRLFLNQPQHTERQRFHIANGALAVATRADHMTGLIQRRAQPLPRHFQQAKAGDTPDLNSGAIHFQGLTQPGFHLTLIACNAHIDEINNNQPAQIAQPHLPGHFIGGLQIGVKRSFLNVAAFGRPSRIDVHRDQRLGVVNHDPAAGGQANLALISGFDLRFDLKAGEQRDTVLIGLKLAQIMRHDLLDKILRLPVNSRVIHQDFANVGPQVIAQGADDDVAFLVN